MKTIETIVYDFSELSEKAKENAIKDWYESENYDFLEDDILNSSILENDIYFSDIKLRYSLGYSQGDGLSFSACFDIEKWLNNQNYSMKDSVKNAILQYIDKVTVKSNSGHYPYAYKNCVSIEYQYTNKEYSNIQLLCEKLEKHIQDYYLDICSQLEKYGYSITDYRMNNEEFSELCDINNYTFLEDGTMKNC